MATMNSVTVIVTADAASLESNQWRPPAFGACKPSWLLSTISDLEDRVKNLARTSPEEEDCPGDTFSERAESYYRKRPQLLTLVYDLHNAYLSLADRYSQTLSLAKQQHHHRRSSSQLSTLTIDHAETLENNSDAESSLSFSFQGRRIDGDAVIAELVMRCVEYGIVVEEMREADLRYGDSGRKIELQSCLLEVLEAERVVLLSENARLGFKAETLVEENEAMAAEVATLKKKAGELARCALRMREDQRVWVMGRKIEDLEAQVRGLEKRNGEYCEMLVKRSDSQQRLKWKLIQKLPAMKAKKDDDGSIASNGSVKKTAKWWTSLRKNLDLFQCVPRSNIPV